MPMPEIGCLRYIASFPLNRLLEGLTGPTPAVESFVPRRSFQDVILPAATRRSLDQALAHVTSHDLIFNRWGLGQRHPTGLALAFNFAGPSGTGKTICAEAIAHTLGRRLLVARYAELESMWMGETPKNLAAVFLLAAAAGCASFARLTPRVGDRRRRSRLTVLINTG